MKTEKNIEVLNGITRTLIDSCKGYQMCQQIARESQFLHAELKKKHAERKSLVKEFQTEIINFGGKYEEKESQSGAIHKGYIQFIHKFKEDEKAAIDALNTGEVFLAEHIESKLNEDGLSSDSINLLRKAYIETLLSEKFTYYLNG